MGHLLLPVDLADLVEGVDLRTEASVDTEYFVVNYRSQSKVVEDSRAVAPHVHRSVLAQALVVKAIDLSDLPAFVVASNQGDSLWVADLKGQQKEEGFD